MNVNSTMDSCIAQIKTLHMQNTVSTLRTWIQMYLIHTELKSIVKHLLTKIFLSFIPYATYYTRLLNNILTLKDTCFINEIKLRKYNICSSSLEMEVATHPSILAWRILWTEEPGRLLSMGSHRVGHDWSDLSVAAASDFPKELNLHFYEIA